MLNIGGSACVKMWLAVSFPRNCRDNETIIRNNAVKGVVIVFRLHFVFAFRVRSTWSHAGTRAVERGIFHYCIVICSMCCIKLWWHATVCRTRGTTWHTWHTWLSHANSWYAWDRGVITTSLSSFRLIPILIIFIFYIFTFISFFVCKTLSLDNIDC